MRQYVQRSQSACVENPRSALAKFSIQNPEAL